MSFLLPLAEVAGEAATAGAGEAAAGAETAGAEAATAEESGSGRVQNFQQGRQQGQGAKRSVTAGEIMGELNNRVESGAE
jgi:hypothetical protein